MPKYEYFWKYILCWYIFENINISAQYIFLKIYIVLIYFWYSRAFWAEPNKIPIIRFVSSSLFSFFVCLFVCCASSPFQVWHRDNFSSTRFTASGFRPWITFTQTNEICLRLDPNVWSKKKIPPDQVQTDEGWEKWCHWNHRQPPQSGAQIYSTLLMVFEK